MNAMTLTTAAGAALAAAAFALAAPAVASADRGPSGGGASSASSSPSGTWNPLADAPTTPEGVAQDIASFKALKEAIRNGTADSTAPIPGSPDPGWPSVTSLPDFPGDLGDITAAPATP